MKKVLIAITHFRKAARIETQFKLKHLEKHTLHGCITLWEVTPDFSQIIPQ